MESRKHRANRHPQRAQYTARLAAKDKSVPSLVNPSKRNFAFPNNPASTPTGPRRGNSLPPWQARRAVHASAERGNAGLHGFELPFVPGEGIGAPPAMAAKRFPRSGQHPLPIGHARQLLEPFGVNEPSSRKDSSTVQPRHRCRIRRIGRRRSCAWPKRTGESHSHAAIHLPRLPERDADDNDPKDILKAAQHGSGECQREQLQVRQAAYGVHGAQDFESNTLR